MILRQNGIIAWTELSWIRTLEKHLITRDHTSHISSVLDLLGLQSITAVVQMPVFLVYGNGRTEFGCTIIKIRRVSQSII